MEQHHVEREAPWLQAKVDQRLALMQSMIGSVGTVKMLGPTAVFTPLTEPPEGASNLEFTRWDHTCDNCGTYDPARFQTGHVQRKWHGIDVIIAFGVCHRCKMEGP